MKLDTAKKLQQKKYRQALGYFLVEGEHLVLELARAAQTSSHWQQTELFVTEAYADWQSPWPTQLISERQMSQLADTKNPQGIVAVAPLPREPLLQGAAGPEQAIYLHEVQDPGNLGTILRTLAWFGGFRCLLSPGSVDPYNPKVVRASMGALFHVPLELEVSLQSLATRYHRIACLDIDGTPISDASFAGHDCYLFGNEARGLPEAARGELGARRFTIPGAARIESLNLASALNMAAYELKR